MADEMKKLRRLIVSKENAIFLLAAAEKLKLSRDVVRIVDGMFTAPDEVIVEAGNQAGEKPADKPKDKPKPKAKGAKEEKAEADAKAPDKKEQGA